MIDPERIRTDFPSLAGRAYLNTAAEGIPSTSVGESLRAYWEDKLMGMEGRAAHFKTEAECCAVVARSLAMTPEEIGFCSCSSEAYNLLASTFDFAPDDEVVINDLDFPSGATPWLAGKDRPRVRVWRSVDGELNLDDLRPLLSPRTRLVQVSLVSFLNGYRIPWAPFAASVRESVPTAVIAVDVTQALGRCVLDCAGADVVISSTHKWSLGIHGGCVVGIRSAAADRLTARAGGWYNLQDAFGAQRFEHAEAKPGAASFATGMPSFAALYALNAGLRYLEQVGIERVARYSDALVGEVHAGLREVGLAPMAPYRAACTGGIVTFRHVDAEAIGRALLADGIHVMSPAGRVRISLHGYNTRADVEQLLASLRRIVGRTASA
ncbi:MAG: csd 3 [Verrucomicrobia bacterium]|nr:csd 3 [Verrucomicrobiota bacterium]